LLRKAVITALVLLAALVLSPSTATVVLVAVQLAVFAVGADGLLRELHVVASSGPTPYGFAFAPDGTLVVTEAFGAQRGKAAASSYAPEDGSLAPVSRTLYSSRFGPIFNSIEGIPLPWAPTTAFALGDANATNFRVFNHFIDTDRAHSAGRSARKAR
jgi:hypothetical protein